MNHMIAISTRVSIEYINIGDIKEFVMIEAVAGKDIAFAPPTEIIWDDGLREEGWPEPEGFFESGTIHDELFIGEGGWSTSLFFFNANCSLRDLFTSIKFDRAENKESIVWLYMFFEDSIPFSIHSISYFFENKSSLT